MGDKIDFNAALEDCKSVRDGIESDEDFQNADFGLVMYHLNTIVQALEIVATAKRGKWIELPKAFDSLENPCKCSICGHVLSFMNGYQKSNFCPNCGAEMNGGKSNGDSK